jgi:hypothetical protein
MGGQHVHNRSSIWMSSDGESYTETMTA